MQTSALRGRRFHTSVLLLNPCEDGPDTIVSHLEKRFVEVLPKRLEELTPEDGERDNLCAIVLRMASAGDLASLKALTAAVKRSDIPVIVVCDQRDPDLIHGLTAFPGVDCVDLSLGPALLCRKIDLCVALHTQWRMLSRQEATMQALYGLLPDSLLRIDRAGYVREYRPGAGAPILAEAAQGLDAHVTSIFPHDCAQAVLDALESALETGTPICLECFQSLHGALRFYEGRMTRIDANNVLLLARDQSNMPPSPDPLRRGEDMQQSAVAELEVKFAEAQNCIQRLREERESRNRGFAQLSHEIRTPLNGVLGMAEVLSETTLTPEQQECVDVIKLSGGVLLSAVNDILDFNKLEAGKLELETINFDVRACLTGVLSILKHNAKEKGIGLTLMVHHSVPQQAAGDPGRLRQILLNLVSNAVKFTDKGEVCVEARSSAAGPAQIRLEVLVTDTGAGIPKSHQASIFGNYTQADPSIARKYGGTGLGLSICSKLVALMDGAIGVSSAPGRGSCFTFDVLLGQELNEEKAQAPTHRPATAPMQFLLVSASPRAPQLAALLEAAGGSVATVNSEASALAALRSAANNSQFLAVLHEEYAGPNAIALGRRIRADSAFQGVKIVLLTATPFRGDGLDAASAGIDAYLPLPVNQEDLARCVGALTSRGGSRLVTRHMWREQDPDGMRVLVVDDSPVNQRVALKMLQRLGCRCDTARNGKECIEALTRRRYDLVLLDCQMPVMNGFEATRIIREQEASSGERPLPIIALTAGAMASDRENCLAAGMTDYLAKPLSAANLAAILDQYAPASPMGQRR